MKLQKEILAQSAPHNMSFLEIRIVNHQPDSMCWGSDKGCYMYTSYS